MAYLRKKLERRTYSQDRYYILIKRQKEGKATFNELTELDEIVNRVPDIRDIVIRESFMTDGPEDTNASQNDPENQSHLYKQLSRRRTFWDRIKSFFTHNFMSQITVIKAGDLAILF